MFHINLLLSQCKIQLIVTNLKSASNVLADVVDDQNYIVQRPGLDSEFVMNGLTATQKGTTVTLNGTSTTATLLFFDKDRDEKGHTSIWGQGFNSNFFNIHNINNSFSLTSGHEYRAQIEWKSGTFTKNNVTYSSIDEVAAASANVFYLYLMKSDASKSTDFIFKQLTSYDSIINTNTVGCFLLYIYGPLTANNVVFEIKLEDLTLKQQNPYNNTQLIELSDKELSVVQRPSYTELFTSQDTVQFSSNHLQLYCNGTNSDYAIFYFLDDQNSGYTIKYAHGFTQNFYDTYNLEHVIPIINGHSYKICFELKSGSISRGGITYTTTQQIIDSEANVVRAYLMTANASGSSDYHLRYPEICVARIDADTIGTFGLYIYQGCTCNNAVFEVYLQDYTEYSQEGNFILEPYWQEEVQTSVNSINNNITLSDVASSTLCFVTDLHWKANWRKSPFIIKQLIDRCNINYFVNGGDILYAHTATKQEALNELSDCLSAFQNCGLPMYCLYGNHDRNRNQNTDNTNALITGVEYINTIMKSFIYRPEITYFIEDNNGITYYWENENYRYISLYWFSSTSRTLECLQDVINTTKPLVILCHGIYYNVYDDSSSDILDNLWILNLFEPYKDQIRCFIQGHAHSDALRYAYDGEVPIILISADTCYNSSTSIGSGLYGLGTIREQSVSVITIDNTNISVVKVGRGVDFTVTDNTLPFVTQYVNGEYVIVPST